MSEVKMTWKNCRKIELFLIACLPEYAVTCLIIFTSFVLFLQLLLKKGKTSIYFGQLQQITLLFFLLSQLASAALAYKAGVLFIQQVVSSFKLEGIFSTASTSFIPRVSHQ